MIDTQYILACRYGQDHPLRFKLSIKTGQKGAFRFADNGLETIKYPVSFSSLGKNAPLMPEVTGDGQTIS